MKEKLLQFISCNYKIIIGKGNFFLLIYSDLPFLLGHLHAHSSENHCLGLLHENIASSFLHSHWQSSSSHSWTPGQPARKNLLEFLSESSQYRITILWFLVSTFESANFFIPHLKKLFRQPKLGIIKSILTFLGGIVLGYKNKILIH